MVSQPVFFARLISALLFITPLLAHGQCPLLLDRPFTLANPVPHRIEQSRGKIASGLSRFSFIQPRHKELGCQDGSAFPIPPWLRFTDSTGDIGALFLGGQEFRYNQESVGATEAGIVANGHKGPISFWADTRTFVEMSGNPSRPSFDREIIDEQSKEVSGSTDYRSYSRFRGDIALETAFGTFAATRDAVHWGPALFENLTFSQEAVPFHYYSFETSLGPLRVASLYGDLLIGENQSYSAENQNTRTLHAHRYELSLGSRWLIGITEQLVLYEMEKPYLMAPIFPLFIAKGFLYEANTNGAIATDITWRSPWSTLFYGEFYLDDLESPSSLLTRDYIQNKWGSMVGVHWSQTLSSWMVGAIAEFSHLEPWVYAHFQARTAQISNLAQPLGNPSGPDSRSLTTKLYARNGEQLYAGIKMGLRWKGLGPGSNQEAPVPETPHVSQESLQGEGSPDGFVEPEIHWTHHWVSLGLSGRIGDSPALRASVRVYR